MCCFTIFILIGVSIASSGLAVASSYLSDFDLSVFTTIVSATLTVITIITLLALLNACCTTGWLGERIAPCQWLGLTLHSATGEQLVNVTDRGIDNFNADIVKYHEARKQDSTAVVDELQEGPSTATHVLNHSLKTLVYCAWYWFQCSQQSTILLTFTSLCCLVCLIVTMTIFFIAIFTMDMVCDGGANTLPSFCTSIHNANINQRDTLCQCDGTVDNNGHCSTTWYITGAFHDLCSDIGAPHVSWQSSLCVVHFLDRRWASLLLTTRFL